MFLYLTKIIGYPLPQDELLSDIERSDMIAFCALIEDKLYNCQVFIYLFLRFEIILKSDVLTMIVI